MASHQPARQRYLNSAIAITIAICLGFFAISQCARAQATTAPTTAPTAQVETVIFFRHGEKPSEGLGQLTPQGLNRALALSVTLPEKFGRPDALFAPDPHDKVNDASGPSFYVRPLATIEPTAIRLGMAVQTPVGYRDIKELNDTLSKPEYQRATIFVAWEHVYAQKAAADLFQRFGGNPSQVPKWPGKDYDSLYVVTIHRSEGKPSTVDFTHDHESLDGQSTTMPSPASK